MRGPWWLLAVALMACAGGNDADTPDPGDDADGDGFAADVDCDDNDFDTNPGAPERCDGKDNNCNDLTDEDPRDVPTTYVDADGDGYGDPASEARLCDPGARIERGGDCDDTNAAINPLTRWFLDGDDDGFGTPLGTLQQCEKPAGYGLTADDCDDGDATIYPGAPEVCDGADNSCNGLVDDADPARVGGTTFHRDADEDGYGDPLATLDACALADGFVRNSDDCDDDSPFVSPDAAEDCGTPYDDDCDGSASAIDAVNCTTFYIDRDGDAFGGFDSVCQCEPVGLYVAQTPEDCDDANPLVNPTTLWYRDADGDGFGSPTNPFVGCVPPNGYVLNALDCNDAAVAVGGPVSHWPDADGDTFGDATANPTEVCPGTSSTLVANDADCDDTNAAVSPLTVWFRDQDGDGFGNPSETTQSCSQPGGFTADNADCADNRPAINPLATEVCDNLDNNCDGLIDDADPSLDESTGSAYYADSDSDGFGAGAPAYACDAPTGFVLDNTDCVPDDGFAYPGAPERCNGFDDDCRGDGEAGAISLRDMVFTDLQAALDATNPASYSDTVSVCEGTYEGPFTLSAQGGYVQLIGNTATPDGVVLTGGGVSNVLTLVNVDFHANGVTLRDGVGRTVAGVPGPVGGAVVVDANSGFTGSFSCFNCVITDNTAVLGGAIFARNGYVSLQSAELHNNTANTSGGGVYLTNGGVYFDQVQATTNLAGSAGGVLYLSAETQFSDFSFNYSTFDNNDAPNGGVVYSIGPNAALYGLESTASNNNADQGGFAYTTDTYIDLNDVQVLDNNASRGGGFYVANYAFRNDLYLGGGQINGNTANDCGGAYVENTAVTMTSSWLSGQTAGMSGNVANTYGGALCMDERSVLWGDGPGAAFISTNSATFGGGMYLYPIFTGDLSGISGVAMTDNDASSAGGGLYVESGTQLVLSAFEATNNNAEQGGGLFLGNGARLSSIAGVPEAQLRNNVALEGGGVYGAPESLGNMTAESNSATNGGGFFLSAPFTGAAVTMGQINVFGNSATRGGGVYLNGQTSLQITSALFVDSNSASQSGGGLYAAGTANFQGNNYYYYNSAVDGGGVYLSNGGTLQVELIGNVASNRGGGAFITGAQSLTVPYAYAVANVANSGGGLFIQDSSSVQIYGDFYDNTSQLAEGSAIAYTGAGSLEIQGWFSGGLSPSLSDVAVFPSSSGFFANLFLDGNNSVYGTPAVWHPNSGITPTFGYPIVSCDFVGCYN